MSDGRKPDALGPPLVHAMVEGQAANREAIEKALIAKFQPPLNTHHL
jgi:hypothetical protein